jgi:hypothetical protein
MIETWTVWEHKLTWDRTARTWTQHDTVIAAGLSKGAADNLMRKGPDRVAVPEEEAETRERLARLDAEATERRAAIEAAGHVTRVDVSW